MSATDSMTAPWKANWAPKLAPKKAIGVFLCLVMTSALSQPQAHAATTTQSKVDRIPPFGLARNPGADVGKSTRAFEDKDVIPEHPSKFRMRTFTEFFTPAISGRGLNIPDPIRGDIGTAFAFNIFWIDYEFAKDWKFAYHQRFNYTPFGGMTVVPRNPRFALRRTNVIQVPGFTTQWDLYLQPGTSPEAFDQTGRSIEFGFRTMTSYDFPKSNFHMGGTTEFTVAQSFRALDPSKEFNNYYGWAAIWGSYDLSSVFSTQHYFTINYKHDSRLSFASPSWDLPMPYIQNGISVNVSKVVWMSAFLNNYVSVLPTLDNSWASLWVSLTLL